VEASALTSQGLAGTAGRSPLLKLRSDEQLITMTRRGNQAAFETLVQRYQGRLLAFCQHMLRSKEDAEDVLQEVFAASYNALLADNRPINTRPWLYRIARNRCLNHLRKPKPSGLDSMDIFERDNGTSTADTVHRREEFRQIVTDVGLLPETQRSALLLREIDALSYDQIAEAMDTTVPSVKSLLVRARVSLAEAAEARLLTCAEVRLELGQVAEGLAKTSAPVRRHLKSCQQCRVFRGELKQTTKALAAIAPFGPLIILQKLGFGGAAAGGAATTAGGVGTAAGGASIAAGSAVAAGSGAAAISGGISAIGGGLAGKAAAGMAAAAIVTAGAVEVKHVTKPAEPVTAQVLPSVSSHPAPPAKHAQAKPAQRKVAAVKPAEPVAAAAPAPAPVVDPTPVPAPVPAPAPDPTVQEDEGTVTLPTDTTTTPTPPPPTNTTTTPTPPPPPPSTTTTPVPPPPPPVTPPTTGTTPTPPPPPPPPPPAG
jgi:RNA polymerase sigma factor (sigma-70 family)